MSQSTHCNLINILKAQKSDKGISLFDHLVDVLAHIKHDDKKKQYNQFQVISSFVKNNTFTFKLPKTQYQVQNIKPKITDHQQFLANFQYLKQRSAKVSNLPNVLFPNFFMQSFYYKQAGISFGQQNNYLIMKAMKILVKLANQAKKAKATQIRFWGKILGFKKDYYIAQLLSTNINNDHIAKNVQPKGQGVNYYSYYVTNNFLQQWIELPLISPQQMLQSKQIKYIFTGDLECQINKYPYFNGKQKHLLKAQIVRITHACQIVPKGIYKINQNNRSNFLISQIT